MMECSHWLPLPAFISDPFHDIEGQGFLYQAEHQNRLTGMLKNRISTLWLVPCLCFIHLYILAMKFLLFVTSNVLIRKPTSKQIPRRHFYRFRFCSLERGPRTFISVLSVILAQPGQRTCICKLPTYMPVLTDLTLIFPSNKAVLLLFHHSSNKPFCC